MSEAARRSGPMKRDGDCGAQESKSLAKRRLYPGSHSVDVSRHSGFSKNALK